MSPLWRHPYDVTPMVSHLLSPLGWLFGFMKTTVWGPRAGITLQCLLMLVDDDDDDDDVNACDDQGNYADRRGGHLSRDGEAMWVCLHVCIHIETYRASWSVVHVTTDIIHAI